MGKGDGSSCRGQGLGVRNGLPEEDGGWKDGKSPCSNTSWSAAAPGPSAPPHSCPQPASQGLQHHRDNGLVKSMFPAKDSCQVHLSWMQEALCQEVQHALSLRRASNKRDSNWAVPRPVQISEGLGECHVTMRGGGGGQGLGQRGKVGVPNGQDDQTPGTSSRGWACPALIPTSRARAMGR